MTTAHEFPMLSNDDADRCGIGQGEICCAYLGVSTAGFECFHFSGLARMLEQRVADGAFGSKRLPTEQYPDCQLPV